MKLFVFSLFLSLLFLSPASSGGGERVVVVFKEGTKVGLQDAQSLLARHNIQTVRRLFQNRSEEEIEGNRKKLEQKTGKKLVDLNLFFEISVDSKGAAAKLIDELKWLDFIAIAYRESKPVPPVPAPDLEPMQGYLDPAPTGMGVRSAGSWAGGDGTGVTIIDMENGWEFGHEDLPLDSSDLIYGSNAPDGINRAHGTAVTGELIAFDNDLGVTGIAPGATMKLVSWYGFSPAVMINAAASLLSAGDILLLEGQVAGPNGACDSSSQAGCVPMEWEYANYAAILEATAAEIIVIEAAGNGGEDLDDPIYEGAFDPTARQLTPSGPPSGAVMVGASDPVTHERLALSNYGARVDFQGWGTGIVTTGYGDLFDGGGLSGLYTNSFGGTSGASAMVAGVFASLRGIDLASDAALSIQEITDVLKATGTPQASFDTTHIGPLPDLQAAAEVLFPVVPTPSPDPDGDGLTNDQEEVLGTAPLDPNTDHDCQDDGTEVKQGLSPTLFQAPTILLQPDFLDFGQVSRRGRRILYSLLRNGGSLPLKIQKVRLSGSEFSIAKIPTVIPVRGAVEIPILFSPTQVGKQTGSVTFQTNDCFHNPVTLTLSGQGVLLPSGIFRFLSNNIN